MRSKILGGLADLMFPRVCHVCHRVLQSDERFVCESCFRDLPRIEYKTNQGGDATAIDSRTLYRVAGALEVEKAVSWIYHNHHTSSSVLLYDMKYRGFSGLARYLGARMAAELKYTGIFTDVDCIAPIPLHPLRLMRRGYNQAYELAKGISDTIGQPIVQPLKARHHRTQTRMEREQRQTNVNNVFYANASCKLFSGRHNLPLRILLVDDMCTTGSTLVSAAQAISQAYPSVRVNILTLALAE